MHIFSDYIQPLTIWLHSHSNWALFITFFISFCESLAVIGSIIPGSLAMTAIGILAGSGVMRIDLTLLAAILGAIAGDGASFLLGYLFRDRISNMWPFTRYPHWIPYGKAFFDRWGSASVLIGRFFGPMRSIVPVIAGMLRMKQWQFLIANTLSAIGWSILYVCPGILIGAASAELSTKSTSRLFGLLVVTLIIIWMVGALIKWCMTHVPPFLRFQLNACWAWLKRHPRYRYLAHVLPPISESNHYPTAGLSLLVLLSSVMFLSVIILLYQGTFLSEINQQIYLFFQSLRSPFFDTFFVIIRLIFSPIPLYCLTLSLFVLAAYFRDWRTMYYWFSLSFISYLLPFALTKTLVIPNPLHMHPMSVIDIGLTYITSVFVFCFFYMGNCCHKAVRIALLILLYLGGIAILYLGDGFLSTVIASYLLGPIIGIAHWMVYRRYKPQQKCSTFSVYLTLFILFLASLFSYSLYFKKIQIDHIPKSTSYVITEEDWWNKQSYIFPSYSTNRFGHQKSPLNIQYMGSLHKLQHALEKSGWKQQPDSFFYSLLMRVEGEHPKEKIPLMAELYQNKKPILILSYRSKNKQPTLVLRFWRSNYYLEDNPQPIWFGSLNHLGESEGIKSQSITPYTLMLQGSHEFEFNQIRLGPSYDPSFSHSESEGILMIKEGG